MNEGALPQHLLNLLVQLPACAALPMMHRNHLTARGVALREKQAGEDSSQVQPQR